MLLFIGRHRVRIAFFIILVCGVFLRLYHIGANSLWFDEVGTLTSDSFASWLSSSGYLHYNMPFYFLVTEAFTLFGDSEALVRLPAAIFGALTIVYIFKIGRLCFNDRVALTAALIISVSSFHVYYSQEARPYSLFMLLGIASTYYMIKALIEPRKKWWASYVIVAALGLYTHLFMAFVLVVHNIFMLWHWRGTGSIKLRTWLVPQVSIVLLFSPILINYGVYYLSIFQRTSETFQALHYNFGRPAPTVSTLAKILIQFFMSYFDIRFVLPAAQPDMSAIGIIRYIVPHAVRIFLLFLVLAGSFSLWKRSEYRTYGLLFLTYLAVPLLLMYMISYDLRILNLRYASFTFPAFCILIALGVDSVRNVKARTFLLVGVVVVNLISLMNIYYNPRYQKEQWRDVAAYIERSEEPGELILFNVDYIQVAFDHYYEGSVPSAGFDLGMDVNDDSAWHELQSTVEGYKYVWLVLSHDFGTGEVYRRALDEHWQVVDERKFKGIRVYRYKKGMS